MKRLRKIIQNVLLEEEAGHNKFNVEDFKNDLSVILNNSIDVFKIKSEVRDPMTDNYVINFSDKTNVQIEFVNGIPYDLRVMSYSTEKPIGNSESQIIHRLLNRKWYNNFYKIYKNASAKSGEAIFNLYARSLGFKIKTV